MSAPHALAALTALGQPTRLEIFQLLIRAEPDGLPAGSIADTLGCQQNTLSSHLSILARSGLVRGTRDGRSIVYRADVEGIRTLIGFLVTDCCDGHPELCNLQDAISQAKACCSSSDKGAKQTEQGSQGMENRLHNVLFLCTGNSARSILAEALLNRAGRGQFQAFSAGSQPKGQVHPYAIDLLKKLNHDVSSLRSKSWQEFATQDAPTLNFVFTVCDNAAQETCPVWPGQPMTAHWGVPDPAAAAGTEAEIRLAFADAYRMLSNRIEIFVNLPLQSLDRLSLQRRLDAIGQKSLSEKAAGSAGKPASAA